MAGILDTLDRLIDAFRMLPGVGAKTAERLAYHVLRSPESEALALAAAIREVKERVAHCPICFHLSDGGPCAICSAPDRDATTVLVVEQPKDVLAFERLGTYRGVYHVLQGRVAPIEGVSSEDLTLQALQRRVAAGGIREVILGTNPDLEGDGTALHVQKALARHAVKVTRIARGIPSGSAIEFANKVILGDALEGRQALADAESA